MIQTRPSLSGCSVFSHHPARNGSRLSTQYPRCQQAFSGGTLNLIHPIMAISLQDQEHYFDDKNAPDGWHEYHLQRRGENLELFRDGTTIRQAVDPALAADNRLFEQGLLRVLEYFLQNPKIELRRTKIEDAVGNLEPYLGRIRKLLNDPPPGRLIQKAGSGELIFTQEVRNKPSAFRSTYQTDLRLHWKPRAMGCGALFQRGRWYFSGRTSVLRHIIQWLQQPASEGVARVVTGHPGSGKSAVLGYIVTCSDREEIEQAELKNFLRLMPEGTQPVSDSIDFAINLRDRSLSETLSALGDCFRCDPGDAVAALANRVAVQRTVLVFDGLEEAAEPIRIAEAVLRPLTGYDHLWLVVGCRRPELSRLGDSILSIDLDVPEWQDATEVAAYVERILLAREETRRSPYRDDARAAKRAAEAVAAAASGNFLVAFIAARSLLERTKAIDPDRERLPRTTEEAFSEYLRRLGERSKLGYARLRRALLPVAYGQGRGLPLDVWSRLTSEDVVSVQDLAAAFILEQEQNNQAVYSFYHQALAEALQSEKEDVRQHRHIADTLIGAVPEQDWLRADWYTRKYLARHAAEAGSLDDLLLDTNFLAVADRSQLLGVGNRAISPEANRRAAWYRLAAGRVEDDDAAERLSYLHLVAIENGADDLAQTAKSERNLWMLRKTDGGLSARAWNNVRQVFKITYKYSNTSERQAFLPEKSFRWRARWARWVPDTPHLVLSAFILHIYFLAVSGDVVASGGDDDDGRIDLWDWRQGDLVGRLKHGSRLTALAMNEHVIATAGYDAVRIWDRKTRELIWETATGDFVEALAIDAELLVSGSQRGTIREWNWRTGQQLGPPWVGYHERHGCLSVNGNILICASLHEGVLRRWDLNGPQLLREVSCEPRNGMLGCMAISRDTVLYQSGSSTDGVIRSFDMKTGQSLGVPLQADDTTILAVDDIGISGGYGGVIRLWDLKTGRSQGSPLRGHHLQIGALAITSDTLFSGGLDGTVRIWNRHSPPIGHPEPLSDLDDSYDGNVVKAIDLRDEVLVSASRDGTVRLLNPTTGKLVAILPNNYGNSKPEEAWAFEPRSVALGKGLVACARRDGVWTWDRHTGEIRDTAVASCQETVTGVVIAGEWLVTLDHDGHLQFWDGSTGDRVDPIPGLNSLPVSALSAEDNVLVFWNGDATVEFWDVRNRQRVGLPLQCYYSSESDPGSTVVSAVAANEKFVVAGYISGAVQIWDRVKGKLIAQPQDLIFTTEAEDKITPVAISGNIVAYKTQRGVQLWDAEMQTSVLDLRLNSSVTSIRMTRSTVYLGCLNGLLRIDA